MLPCFTGYTLAQRTFCPDPVFTSGGVPVDQGGVPCQNRRRFFLNSGLAHLEIVIFHQNRPKSMKSTKINEHRCLWVENRSHSLLGSIWGPWGQNRDQKSRDLTPQAYPNESQLPYAGSTSTHRHTVSSNCKSVRRRTHCQHILSTGRKNLPELFVSA